MKKNTSREKMGAALFFVLLFGGASSATLADDIDITVSFDGSGCPTGVDKPDQRVKPAGVDKVRWLSDPVTGGFQIFFDPFNGAPIIAKSNGAKEGETSYFPVKTGSPVGVDYKYTIFNPACPGTALDPRIKVF